jgi:hypothetical protein
MTKFAIRNPFRKEKVISVNMLSEQNGIYHTIHRQNVKLGIETLLFNGGKYIVDLNKAVNDTKNIPMLFYLVGNSEPLGFEKIHFKDAKIFNQITESTIFSRFYTQAQQKMFIVLIVILIVGIVAIGAYALYSQNQLMQQIAKLITK